MAPMTPDELGAAALGRLRDYGVSLGPGLSDAELQRVQDRFGFEFTPSHRGFLRAGLPSGPGWPDWRAGSADELQDRLDQPVAGVLFDVKHNCLWWPEWGPRPAVDAESAARTALGKVPRLVPIHGHRFVPAAPAPEPTPVLSVVQSDVIGYGRNLLEYVEREFGARNAPFTEGEPVPFWSVLAGR